jgi:glycosyltransferase involved in cell wall biosynthesis
VSASWVVLAERSRFRWGGDLRRAHLFDVLAERTNATVVDGWSVSTIRREVRRPRLGLGRRSRVACVELLGPEALKALADSADPAVLDVHDDPLLQAEALGVALAPEAEAAARLRRAANLAAFRWHVTPSRRLAELMELDLDRVVVAGNGTNSTVVTPGPWPSEPAVGLVSGAAPGRGIETLIDAAREVRSQVPSLKLLLWLAATGDASANYLADLKAATASEPWIAYGSAPYDRIGAELARASVLVVPTPAHPYWDAIAPVKLFDCLAAGRPVVVTPRPEPAAIIRAEEAGVVAATDAPTDLAAGILELLLDDPRAREYGANARRAAETTYDWRTIGARLADQVLERER